VVSDFRRSRQLVGLSPQEFNFDRFLSVEEILTYQGGYYGMPLSQAKPRARELLEQFELTDKRRASYLELSGGMKRRLSLARALMHRPKLLILDEPTAGMDVELRLELWDFLKIINAGGMTIFMTSHYLEEVEMLCNRVGIVNHGLLVALEDKVTLIADHGKDTLQEVFLELVGRRTHG
jgi:ABC-2 type transport system ATP-binding protein